MLVKQLETRIRYRPGVAIIDLYGDIDAFAEETLQAAFSDIEGQNPASVLLNFSQVGYINSAGISLIASLLGRARQAPCRLLAYGLSDHYQKIFQITRLADYINVFTDEESALAG